MTVPFREELFSDRQLPIGDGKSYAWGFEHHLTYTVVYIREALAPHTRIVSYTLQDTKWVTEEQFKSEIFTAQRSCLNSLKNLVNKKEMLAKFQQAAR